MARVSGYTTRRGKRVGSYTRGVGGGGVASKVRPGRQRTKPGNLMAALAHNSSAKGLGSFKGYGGPPDVIRNEIFARGYRLPKLHGASARSARLARQKRDQQDADLQSVSLYRY